MRVRVSVKSSSMKTQKVHIFMGAWRSWRGAEIKAASKICEFLAMIK